MFAVSVRTIASNSLCSVRGSESVMVYVVSSLITSKPSSKSLRIMYIYQWLLLPFERRNGTVTLTMFSISFPTFVMHSL
jgi:hypothetical protein